MKKIFGLLILSLLVLGPVSAKDKAVIKVGSVSLKSTSSGDSDSVAGASQGSFINVSIGGTKGVSAGTMTILFPSSELANFTKNYTLDLKGPANDGSSTKEALVTFLVTKTKVNGLNSTVTGYASVNESVGSGTMKIISYNSDTGELKFTVNGSVNPYSQSKTKLGQTPQSSTVNKAIKVQANVTVTIE